MTEIIIFAVILLSLLGLGVVFALTGERIRNAIKRGAAEARERGLAELALKRREMAERLEVSADELVPRLNRIALDASGEPPEIDQLIAVETKPPRLVALGRDFAEYVFAPISNGLGLPRKSRRYPVDALSGDLFVAEELAQIFGLAASQFGVSDAALPHTKSWTLTVVEQEEKSS